MLRGVIFGSVFALVMALSGAVTMAAHAAYDTSQIPPPTKYDRSGADQDEYLVPTFIDSNGNDIVYQVNGDYPPSSLNSTGGAASVTVTTMYMDVDKGYYVDGPSWTLTYNLAATASEAANRYHSVLGACDASWGEAKLTAYIENVADATGRYLPKVSVTSYNIVGSGATSQAMRVLDGETRVLAVKGVGIGVAPGTNTVKYYLGEPGASAPVYTEKVWVPACGSEVPPAGDPGATPTVKANPRGMVRLANCRTGLIKGYTSTKGVRPTSGMTTFKYRKGTAKPIVFKMRNGVTSWKIKRFRHVRKGVAVKLWYKKGSKWVLLAKARSTRCRTDS
jgi:hypothetical protein